MDIIDLKEDLKARNMGIRTTAEVTRGRVTSV